MFPTPKHLSSSRRRSHAVTPRSTPRSGSGNTSSRFKGHNVSLQSSIMEDTISQKHVNTVGVMLSDVTEMLGTTSSNELSVNLSTNGWSWIVSRTKLLIWKYRAGVGQTPVDLPVPGPSEARLVQVISRLGASRQEAACVAVTTDGRVRYWPSLSQPLTYLGTQAVLQGDETCVHAVEIQGDRCIVATSHSRLFMLQLSAELHVVNCRAITHAQQGLVRGLSRRVSSLFWGGHGAANLEEPLNGFAVGMVTGETAEIYVLSGPNLQKWLIKEATEELVYKQNVLQFFSECAAVEIWKNDVSHLTNLQAWLLDIQYNGDGLTVLGAATNPDVDSTLYYALATMNTEGSMPPQSIFSFIQLKFTQVFPSPVTDVFRKKLVLTPASSSVPPGYCHVYDQNSIKCTSYADEEFPVQVVDLTSHGDSILGAGLSDEGPLFFSYNYGFISTKDSLAEQSMKEVIPPSVTLNESLPMASMDVSQLSEMSKSEDKVKNIKSALIHFYQRKLGEAQFLVDELCCELIPSGPRPDSPLDQLVVQVSEGLIDDPPTHDPRWASNNPAETSCTTTSLIIIHQLEDKLKALEYFVRFLKNTELWEKLSCVCLHGLLLSTHGVLLEHAEKVQAMVSLRQLHAEHSDLMDAIIQQAMQNRPRLPGQGPNLTANDLFYREVSRVEEFVRETLVYEEELMSLGLQDVDVIKMVAACNHVLHSMLCAAVLHRKSQLEAFPLLNVPITKIEFLPWTSCGGVIQMRKLLCSQHTLTVTRALSLETNAQRKKALLQQLADLTDLILDGYMEQLDALDRVREANDSFSHAYREVKSQFEKTRKELLQAFVKEFYFERAVSLAEKYHELPLLVEVCDKTANHERMTKYMDEYINFAEHVFQYYTAKGGRGKLLASPLASHPRMCAYLQTSDNKQLSWLHDIGASKFYQAHRNLFDLAIDEEKSLSRKKTLLSLSKLAAMASDSKSEDIMQEINVELDLILNQESLPPSLIEAYGMDAAEMPVFKPQQLIQIFVSTENYGANEYDFKKALDLMQYIKKNDPTYKDLLVLIWSQVILSDDWSSLDTTDPMTSCRQTVFMKTVELVHSDSELTLKEFLPRVEELLKSQQLQTLSQDKNFLFLVKAGCEYIARMTAV